MHNIILSAIIWIYVYFGCFEKKSLNGEKFVLLMDFFNN